MIEIGVYKYDNEEAIINAFKNTLKPKFNTNKREKYSEFTVADLEEYSILMPWFKENEYYIEEFPNVIRQQLGLKEFGYDTIRSRIYIERGNTNGSVAWEERRQLIDSLTIKKKNDFPVFKNKPEIEEIIKEISSGKGELHTRSLDEQLSLLNNTIEYLLKEKNGFKKVNQEIFYGFINEQKIIKFRKDTHIFRHGSKEAISERREWSDDKKKFYARLGIIIITNIYNNS